MNRYFLVVVAALLVAGCSFLETTSTSTTSTSVAPETEAPTTTALPGSPVEAVSPCNTADKPFAGDGIISAFGGANGDATQISGIRWAAHTGCERVVVDLLTADGAPAGAIDPVGVDYDAARGVVRVNLPEAITRSAIVDSLFDGELVRRAYVIASRDGGVAIDIHIGVGSRLELRAFEVDSPSRIVIDVRPDLEATEVLGAATANGLVLLSPLAEVTDTSVVVSGYARPTGGDLVARVYVDDEAIVEEPIELTSGTNLWREFELTIPDLPARPLDLEVGFTNSEAGGTVNVSFDATDRSAPDPPEV